MITAIGSAVRPAITSAISIASDSVTSVLDAQFAAFMASLTGSRALFDPSRASTRFQDATASALVTADGQPFARLNDSSGANNHISQSTAASMPLYRTDGALHWADFDGSNDFWQSLVNLDMTGTSKVTVIAGMRCLSDAATAVLAELSANVNANAGAWIVTVPNNPGATAGFGSRGSGTPIGTQATRAAAPASFVLTGVGDILAPLVSVQINNGSVSSTGGSQGAGPYGNFPFFLGGRGGASLFFRGLLYGLLIIGRLLTADELLLCKRWMASKTGVALA